MKQDTQARQQRKRNANKEAFDKLSETDAKHIRFDRLHTLKEIWVFLRSQVTTRYVKQAGGEGQG